MRIHKSIALAVALLCTPSFTPAWAQSQQCGPYDKVTETLKNKYKEQSVGVGMVNPKLIMEHFLSESGTWTLVLVNSDGMACIAAAGKDWMGGAVHPGEPS